MTDTPHVLLAHHLKTLKLPTFLREYDKVARAARQSWREGNDNQDAVSYTHLTLPTTPYV